MVSLLLRFLFWHAVLLIAGAASAAGVNGDLEQNARQLLAEKIATTGYTPQIGDLVWAGISHVGNEKNYRLSVNTVDFFRHLQCVQVETTHSNFPLCFRVSVLANLPVAKQDFSAGAMVSADDFMMRQIDLTRYDQKNKSILNLVYGRQWLALSSIKAGRPAFAQEWRLVQAVLPAERTSAQLKFPQGNLTVPVVILEAGDPGQTIRIRRDNTPYVYTARITGYKNLEILEP